LALAQPRHGCHDACVTKDGAEWVEMLCEVPLRFRSDGDPIRVLMQASAPDLSDVDRAKALIRHRLGEEPALAEAWQTYSYDKVSRPRPYLDDCEVGYFDGKRRDVVRYDDRLDACADYIVREARSVLANP
jgi:hypothetical protein